MKGQKGSALLTVILILFVTITIGSALSMMIVYNYRLRSLDISIQRAEYDAVEIMDYVVFATKQEIINRLYDEYDGWVEKVNSKINYAVNLECQEYYNYEDIAFEEANTTEEYEEMLYKYRTEMAWQYITWEGKTSESVELRTHKSFDECLAQYFVYEEGNIAASQGKPTGVVDNSWIDSWIKKLKSPTEPIGVNKKFAKNGDSERFIRDGLSNFVEGKYNLYIELEEISGERKIIYDTNTITVPLVIYYQRPDDPVVQIKTTLTILIPTYREAWKKEVYNNLEKMVGYTKMEYKNWGYL